MKYGLARVTALGLVFAAELLGQTHPSFSGTWLLDPGLSVGLRDEERKGMTLVVRQTDREMVFERTVVGGQTRVIRYALDGSESTSRAGSVEIKARSRWEGEKLITEGTQSASVLFIRIKAKFIETRSVSNDGQVMTAHSTFGAATSRPIANWYSSEARGPSDSVRATVDQPPNRAMEPTDGA